VAGFRGGGAVAVILPCLGGFSQFVLSILLINAHLSTNHSPSSPLSTPRGLPSALPVLGDLLGRFIFSAVFAILLLFYYHAVPAGLVCANVMAA